MGESQHRLMPPPTVQYTFSGGSIIIYITLHCYRMATDSDCSLVKGVTQFVFINKEIPGRTLCENVIVPHRPCMLLGSRGCNVPIPKLNGLIEQGLTSHQTHYRSYRVQVFRGQMTQPTVSKH